MKTTYYFILLVSLVSSLNTCLAMDKPASGTGGGGEISKEDITKLVVENQKTKSTKDLFAGQSTSKHTSLQSMNLEEAIKLCEQHGYIVHNKPGSRGGSGRHTPVMSSHEQKIELPDEVVTKISQEKLRSFSGGNKVTPSTLNPEPGLEQTLEQLSKLDPVTHDIQEMQKRIERIANHQNSWTNFGGRECSAWFKVLLAAGVQIAFLIYLVQK